LRRIVRVKRIPRQWGLAASLVGELASGTSRWRTKLSVET
jgi:hypothetical protein